MYHIEGSVRDGGPRTARCRRGETLSKHNSKGRKYKDPYRTETTRREVDPTPTSTVQPVALESLKHKSEKEEGGDDPRRRARKVDWREPAWAQGDGAQEGQEGGVKYKKDKSITSLPRARPQAPRFQSREV